MMMKMTKTKTEQNGFFGDISGDSQTCLGAALGGGGISGVSRSR